MNPILLDSTAAMLAALVSLAALIAAVYRLGVWRQEMWNIKHNVGMEVTRLREETTRSFVGITHRFDAIDRRLDAAAEQRVAGERWQARVDANLSGLDQRVARLEGVPCQEAA